MMLNEKFEFFITMNVIDNPYSSFNSGAKNEFYDLSFRQMTKSQLEDHWISEATFHYRKAKRQDEALW